MVRNRKKKPFLSLSFLGVLDGFFTVSSGPPFPNNNDAQILAESMSKFFARLVVAMALAPLLFLSSGILTALGGRGVHGSGLSLNPGKAQKELEPWSRMKGGMVADALDEAGIDLRAGAGAEKEKIVIRCKPCGTLNEEDAKFCKHCGKAI